MPRAFEALFCNDAEQVHVLFRCFQPGLFLAFSDGAFKRGLTGCHVQLPADWAPAVFVGCLGALQQEEASLGVLEKY